MEERATHHSDVTERTTDQVRNHWDRPNTAPMPSLEAPKRPQKNPNQVGTRRPPNRQQTTSGTTPTKAGQTTHQTNTSPATTPHAKVTRCLHQDFSTLAAAAKLAQKTNVPPPLATGSTCHALECRRRQGHRR